MWRLIGTVLGNAALIGATVALDRQPKPANERKLARRLFMRSAVLAASVILAGVWVCVAVWA